MKDLKISKELLSEVLGIHTILMNPIIEPGNNIGYLVYGSQNTLEEVRRNHKQINIYEFASKSKEWAFSKGYTILTEYVKQNGVFSYVVSNKQSIENYGYLENVKVLNYIPHNKTEYEAIIKACEWVLKEIDEKGIESNKEKI